MSPRSIGVPAGTMAGIGLGRVLAQGLLLMRELFAIPPPSGIGREFLRDPAALALAEMTLRDLPELQDYTRIAGWGMGLRHIRYQSRLKRGLRYRWSIWNTIWFNERDWAEIALPNRLFPLYYPLRPILWLRRYSRRFRKSA